MAKPTSRLIVKSTKTHPYTPQELMEIEDIQRKAYWARKPLKKSFCERNNRSLEELDQYFINNKRVPDNGTGKQSTSTKARASNTSSAPKEQVTESPVARVGRAVKSEIRVTFKAMRIEGDTIIFEI